MLSGRDHRLVSGPSAHRDLPADDPSRRGRTDLPAHDDVFYGEAGAAAVLAVTVGTAGGMFGFGTTARTSADQRELRRVNRMQPSAYRR